MCHIKIVFNSHHQQSQHGNATTTVHDNHDNEEHDNEDSTEVERQPRVGTWGGPSCPFSKKWCVIILLSVFLVILTTYHRKQTANHRQQVRWSWHNLFQPPTPTRTMARMAAPAAVIALPLNATHCHHCHKWKTQWRGGYLVASFFLCSMQTHLLVPPPHSGCIVILVSDAEIPPCCTMTYSFPFWTNLKGPLLPRCFDVARDTPLVVISLFTATGVEVLPLYKHCMYIYVNISIL